MTLSCHAHGRAITGTRFHLKDWGGLIQGCNSVLPITDVSKRNSEGLYAPGANLAEKVHKNHDTIFS